MEVYVSFHDVHGSLWRLPKHGEPMKASTTLMGVCGSLNDFYGSLWGLAEAVTAIDACEYLEGLPIRSRAVPLVKSRIGLYHRLVSWCEILRSQANRASDVGVGSRMPIASYLLDTGEYQDTSPQQHL